MTDTSTCERLVRSYIETMGSEFSVNFADNTCFIVTPFERPDGELVEISAQVLPDGRFRLSDGGDTLGYLYVNGLILSRYLREDVRRICRRFDTVLTGAELLVEAHPQETGSALHRLTQTILASTNLIEKRRPFERLDFAGEVESFIIVSGVTYDADFEVRGRDSTHRIRFHVNSNRGLLIQPISAASEPVAFSWSERWAYRFTDILLAGSRWRCVAVLDDRGDRAQVWSQRALVPLRDFMVPWSAKDHLSAMLAASPTP